MLSRPRVCRAADIAKVPLITARRPAALRGRRLRADHDTARTDWGVMSGQAGCWRGPGADGAVGGSATANVILSQLAAGSAGGTAD
jgi:hypothetical protein